MYRSNMTTEVPKVVTKMRDTTHKQKRTSWFSTCSSTPEDDQLIDIRRFQSKKSDSRAKCAILFLENDSGVRIITLILHPLGNVVPAKLSKGTTIDRFSNFFLFLCPADGKKIVVKR